MMSFRTSVRIYKDDAHFPGMEVSNFFDFGTGSTTDLDVFVRLSTDIKNLDKRGKPFFFADMVSFKILKKYCKLLLIILNVRCLKYKILHQGNTNN